MQAALDGLEEVVEALLRAGAATNLQHHKFGGTALMYAAQSGYDEIVEMIAQAGTDLDHRNSLGHTALITAASQNQCHIIQELTASGATVDLSDNVRAGLPSTANPWLSI